jgi:hypothetical protein
VRGSAGDVSVQPMLSRGCESPDSPVLRSRRPPRHPSMLACMLDESMDESPLAVY